MKISFIGAGNMAGAIINGLINSGFPVSDITVSDSDHSKLTELKKSGVVAVYSNSEAAQVSDIIVLSVKPSVVSSVLEELSTSGAATGKILVSIAAGISSSFLKETIGQDTKVVRTMPNTPAMVGEGMTVICTPENLTETELDAVKSIFQAVGRVEVLDEKYIDAVTAISGSGPAYVCMFIEAMADGGVLCGLPRAQALQLATQTIMGTAKMIIESGINPAVLKDMVCSPGGTTIEAVHELEQGGMRASLISAVKRCANKSATLGGK